jgi:Transposase DDE domain
VKLHLLCATNSVPVSYEITPANVAKVELSTELLTEANLLSGKLTRKVFGDLAYRSESVDDSLAEIGVL